MAVERTPERSLTDLLSSSRAADATTGWTPAFRPAQKLYESAGFSFCGPFGEYREDPHSAYMTLRL